MPSPNNSPGPNPQLFYRAHTIRATDVNEETREVRLTFSSEARVKRWFGVEILKHGPENVDLSRLENIGAVLVNHDPNQIAGAIRDVEIGADRRGHAVIAFDKDPAGEAAFLKARSGSLRGVSVGYLINQARRVLEDETYVDPDLGELEGPTLIAERWTPYEITLTPIPADADVGVGRDATRSLDGILIEQAAESTETKGKPMDEKVKQYLVSRGLDPEATEEVAEQFLKDLPALDAARKREAETEADPEPNPASPPDSPPAPRDALALYKRYQAVEMGARAMDLLGEGKSDEEIEETILSELAAARGKPAGNVSDEAGQSKAGELDPEALGRALSNPVLSFA